MTANDVLYPEANPPEDREIASTARSIFAFGAAIVGFNSAGSIVVALRCYPKDVPAWAMSNSAAADRKRIEQAARIAYA